MPKALITGGAGFIGSHVVDRFLAEGYDVDIVDDLSSGKRTNVSPKATLHVLDVRSDEAAALIRATRYDVIAHLAAQIDVRKSVNNPRFDADINVMGTINLLEALKSRSDSAATRFVFVSTGGALYGDAARTPSDESTPKNPDAPYGIAKLAAEFYTAYYSRVHKLETAALRLGNVYGPRQDPHGEAGVIAIFCGWIGEGKPVRVFGDGKQTRDYVYVGDVAAAVYTVSRADLPPAGAVDARAFNIATGKETSVLQLAEALGRIAGTAPQFDFQPERRGEIKVSVLDCGKARSVLGWTPAVTIDEGLARTYNWFLEQGR